MFLAAVGLFAFLASVAFVARNPQNGLIVLLAGFVASDDVVLWAHPVTIDVRHISLQPIDLALVTVFIPYVLRRLAGERWDTPWPLWVLFGLFLFETARGLESYGAQQVLNSDRRVAWLIGSALYAASVRFDRRLGVAIGFAAVTLIGIALYGFASTGIHGADTARLVDGEWLPLRPLNAAGAFVLLTMLVAVWSFEWLPRKLTGLLLIVGVPAFVLVQQRTVLVAAILVLPILWLVGLSRLNRTSRHAGYAFVGLTALAVPPVAWLLTRSHSLAQTFHGVNDPNGTLQWRIASWKAMLQLMTPANWLIGSPAGRPENRYVLGQLVTVQAHSAYVEIAFRFGLPGLAAIFAMWLTLLRRLHRSDSLAIPRWTGYMIVVATMVFAAAYMLGLESGLWLGLLIAATAKPAYQVVRVTRRLPNTTGSSQPA